MKKIFTLLFSVGLLTAAYAQPGARDNRGSRDNQQYDQKDAQQNGQWDKSNGYSNGKDVAINNGRYDKDDRFDHNNGANDRGMSMQIARINREYNFKIQRVRNDFFMGRFEKMRSIRSLEYQRDREIKMMYARSASRDYPNDHGYGSNHRY